MLFYNVTIKTVKVFTVLLSIIISTPTYATSPIEKCSEQLKEDLSTDAISRCLDKATYAVDRDLQTWINLHQFNLEEQVLINGRNSALNMFKRSQNNFSTYRENNCRWQYLTISPATTAGLAYKECYILLSQQRIDELTRLADTTKLN